MKNYIVIKGGCVRVENGEIVPYIGDAVGIEYMRDGRPIIDYTVSVYEFDADKLRDLRKEKQALWKIEKTLTKSKAVE